MLKNRVQLIGNLGDNIETKSLENGNVVANFSLATNESYKNSQGEKITETYWHKCTAWGKTAELLEKFTSKGSEIAIEGKLSYSTYEKDGVKMKSAEIVVNEVLFLDKKEQ